jgi:hypothetical protein
VLRLIVAFAEIALHRRGPEDLPSSRFLFGLVLAVYVIVAFVTLRLGAVVERLTLMLVVDTAFSLAFVWAVLRAFEHERRFRQTMSALLGTDALLNLLSVPLLYWNRALEAAGAEPTAPAVAFLVLAVWSIDVSGFILARALGRPYALGVAIMLGYVLLSVSLRLSLFPPLPPAS